MIVEDGTGIENADSYVSVEFADSYFSARSVSEWEALETSQKESALIRATDFVDNMFLWLGKKATTEQALRFPRVNLKDYEGNDVLGVPTCLKQAVCDASLVALNEELFQTSSENGDVVSENITSLSFTYSKKEKVTVPSGTLYDSINTRLRGLFLETNNRRFVSGKVERV